MVDGGGRGDPGDLGDLPGEVLGRGDAGRSSGDDVGAQGELCVDQRLLVVGGREDAEVDAEGEEQADDDEPAVDRRAAAPGAGEQEAAHRGGASRRRPPRQPSDDAAAQPDEEQRGADPQQGRAEEHVDRERERRVGVRVHDRREAGAGGEPVDEEAADQGQHVKVQALPEWRAVPAGGAPRVAHRAAEGRDAGADARRGGAGEAEADAGEQDPQAAERREVQAARDDDGDCGGPGGDAEQAGDDADDEALDGGQYEQPASRRAAGSQQGEVAAVGLDRAERGQVGETEGDQCARHRQHDVEGLRVEGIAGGAVQRIGEVVDEAHLTEQRALDAVARLVGGLERG